MQPVDLNAIVEDGMFLLEAGCEHPAVRFVRELTPGLPEIEADPVQVRQVLMNLVMNAVHAIPDSGTITVRTGREGSFLTLGVDDTGEGMPPEIARQVFDPFFTTKDVGKGTGLGLSVVQGIVASHGGSIHLETSPGNGARFLVRFPLPVTGSSGGNDNDR
jgi:signal transduction histidine kinase